MNEVILFTLLPIVIVLSITLIRVNKQQKWILSKMLAMAKRDNERIEDITRLYKSIREINEREIRRLEAKIGDDIP